MEQKTEFERKFILKYRSLFSESLSPDRYIQAPSMKISTKKSPDLALYRFKSRPIPLNIKPQARGMMSHLESQGVIRQIKASEQSEFCAPSGFVPKKSRKLRFVIDFTALNKYVQRPVHSFLSSDQVAQSIKSSTTHIACVDFPSGYFQALLHPDSQRYTAFNTEFGKFLFLRAPQGLSSSGDHFNCTTNQFFSILGDWLNKQVEDTYVTASSIKELRERLEITARESLKRGVTWSISKFFADRETNIVSGHEVVLDPSGKQPPLVGSDPAHVEKLANMQHSLT